MSETQLEDADHTPFWIMKISIGKVVECKKKKNSECSGKGHLKVSSKVMLKILQARLQQYMNRELPDVQAGFRKGRGTRYQIANIR